MLYVKHFKHFRCWTLAIIKKGYGYEIKEVIQSLATEAMIKVISAIVSSLLLPAVAYDNGVSVRSILYILYIIYPLTLSISVLF